MEQAAPDPCLEPVEALAARLGTDLAQGLASEEAARRLARDGPNELHSKPPPPAWRRFAAQFRDPLIYLLLGAIAISLAAWAVEGAHGWPVDALVIALIVVANAILAHVQESRAESAVAALAKTSAAASVVLRDGREQRIASSGLVRGDLLVLAEGDAVGADGRVVRASALRVQEASLTGESEPVLKEARALPAPVALGDRFNMVFNGTAVVQGRGLALVTATGMATEVGSIARLLESAQEERTPLQREVARIGRTLGLAVVAIAVLVVATVLALSHERGLSTVIAVLLLGVSLAVAAVPEGLPAILSLVLALGVQRMARHNAIVKRLSSVETLGSASVICSDKTGTLTRSEMTIRKVCTASGRTRLTGAGYVPVGEVLTEDGRAVAGDLLAEHVVVLSGGSLASDARLPEGATGEWQAHGDPTEVAFLVAERKLGVHERRQRRFARVAEVPFTSERRMMSSIEVDHEHGDERIIVTKGAPDVLLARCTLLRKGGAVVPLDDGHRRRILDEVEQLAAEALRTLGVAYRPLAESEGPGADESLEHDLVFAGVVGIIDPPREEAAQAIGEARRAGIRVIMITGDHPRTAARIAADLGIVEAGAAALTGLDIDQLDEAAFREAVRMTSVYARVAPGHKMRIVDALQADGHIVAMTGDGVNDAPALKSADIGVAMGIAGTEVAKQAAKMILADDNFATIVVAVRHGRAIFSNIRKFLRYLLSSNMGEVLTVFFGVVLAGAIGLSGGSEAVALPLLATQILWINLVTDSGPAIAMGVDPPVDDVMARKPRRAADGVIDAAMWAGVLGTGLVMAAATLFTIDWYLPGGFVAGERSLDSARTAGFTVLVLAQLFNAFNARSEVTSAFRRAFANRWLWGAVALAALLQVAVVHVGILNAAFGTVPLDAGQWAMCVLMASTVLWASEMRKLAHRALRLQGR
ncbi:MAG TPA: cation-translocating P-type ATPase [Usitatibacter sp.]|nr:cation-translocating P-type ATPase [Usitatibacter sp.]